MTCHVTFTLRRVTFDVRFTACSHQPSPQASHLLDIASCCAVLFPIVWSIQQLKTEARSEAVAEVAAAAASDQADAEADTSDMPAIREKLLQLRGFYSQVVFATSAAAALIMKTPNP